MAAEVATFLLEEKLRSLLNDKALVYPRLRMRIKEAITCLDRLSRFFRMKELSPEQVEDPLTRQLRKSVYLADYFVDVYHLRKRRHKGLAKWFPLFGQRDLKRGIKRCIIKIRDAKLNSIPEGKQDESQGEGVVSGEGDGRFHRWRRISHLMDEDSNAVGQESDMKKLVADLFCDGESIEEGKEFRVLPVVGPPGSGKTMMVRRVYNRVDVKNHFEYRAWVSLSKEFSFRQVLVTIIEQTLIKRSGNIDYIADAVLSEMLFKKLLESKYLIVLDDVNDAEAWYALTKSLPDSRNGSRVILTTYDMDVAKSVDPWASPLCLQQLSGEERWELLLKQVGGRVGDLNEVRDVITSKCWQSPLEAVLLGGTLSVTRDTYLPAFIERLPLTEIVERDSSAIVSLCIHELPPRLKLCFLYFGLFPRGFEVPVRRILWFWISEGFLNPSPEGRKMGREPEDLADSIFEELCNRRLVEVTKWKSDGCPKTCRVLGFLHDHFSERSMASGFFHVHREETSESGKFPEQIYRLIEYSNIKSCSEHYMDQSLRSFVSFNTSLRGRANRDIGMFFKGLIVKRCFALLKTLDLEGVYKPLLPKEIKNLVLLKFLGLRSTVLDSIPSFVGDLPCLETLDLKHTNVTVLPKSIWKAKSLRHLYLNEARIDKLVRKPTKGFLINLQTLRGFYVDDKKVIAYGLDGLTNLRKLGLTCHRSALKAVCSWIWQLPNLQSLKLRSIDEFGKSSELEFDSLQKLQELSGLYLLGRINESVRLEGLFPMNIRKLTLSQCQLQEDPMAALGQLPHLRILRLLAHSYDGPTMTCVQGGFPHLLVLKLWMLDNLEQWDIEEEAMPLVRELEIRRCDELRDIHGLSYLRSLKDLILTNMSKTNESKELSGRVKRSIGGDVHVKVNEWDFSHDQVNLGDSDFGSDTAKEEVKEDSKCKCRPRIWVCG